MLQTPFEGTCTGIFTFLSSPAFSFLIPLCIYIMMVNELHKHIMPVTNGEVGTICKLYNALRLLTAPEENLSSILMQGDKCWRL
jgi:hypothetical protein